MRATIVCVLFFMLAYSEGRVLPMRVYRKHIVVNRNKRADAEKGETDYLVSDRHRSKREVNLKNKEREHDYLVLLSYDNKSIRESLKHMNSFESQGTKDLQFIIKNEFCPHCYT